jgi:hypothetical protein
VSRNASSSVTLNQPYATCGSRALTSYNVGNIKLSFILNTTFNYKYSSQSPTLPEKNRTMFCKAAQKFTIPLREIKILGHMKPDTPICKRRKRTVKSQIIHIRGCRWTAVLQK